MQPWQGKSMWIWQLQNCSGGNVNAIIAQAKAAGLNSIIVKSHDGTSRWSQFSHSLIDALHRAGLKVGAWGYCYGHNPTEEAARAVDALNMGADFYVADVEIEFDKSSMWPAAEQLISAIKAGAKGKPIGYTTFGLPQYHPGFPFQIFSKYCEFVMPQVYWCDFKLPASTATISSVSHFKKYGIPIVPIGQSYGPVTPQQISQFISACNGLPGYSFWDYQHCTAALWESVIGGLFKEGSNVSVLQLGSTCDAVKQLQTELNKVLGIHLAEDGNFGPATAAAVKSFQQIHHLTVDGIVGPQTTASLALALKALEPKPAPTPEPAKPVEQPKPAPAPQPQPTTQPQPSDNVQLVQQAVALLEQAQNILKGVK